MGRLLGGGGRRSLHRHIAALYDRRFKKFGAGAKGVYWKGEESQHRRFVYLTGIIEPGATGVSVNDLGCGYGALFDFLAETPVMDGGSYTGYDISRRMVAEARRRVADPRAHFVRADRATRDADYSFVSGTFNIPMGTEPATWRRYVEEALEELWSRTRKGLAFNMLDARADDQLGNLFYADSGQFFDFCARVLSPDVTLMHTRPLPDWTIWVRR